MPVHRVAAHPDLRVYSNAGVVIFNGSVWMEPIQFGYETGAREEIAEFGMAFFQNIDWTDDLQIYIESQEFLYIRTPHGVVSFLRRWYIDIL